MGAIRGKRYRHYKKGTVYEVLTLAVHTETGEEMVVYQNTEDLDLIWTRPKAMFEETVEHGGQTVARFEALEEEG